MFTKSKLLSQVFENFDIIEQIVDLMQNDQFIIQSDAHKTFDNIFKGRGLTGDANGADRFIEWIENDNKCGEIVKQDNATGQPVNVEA